MRILIFLIALILSCTGAAAIDYYFTYRINFPPGESIIHNQTITSDSNVTITLPSGFTFISSNLSYTQSGSNYTWSISSPSSFSYSIQSPSSCTEDTTYDSNIYENTTFVDEFTYVCIPDIKVVDYKVEYGHGCGNYLDDLIISNESATLFNLLRVWNIGHFLSPDEDATDATISCTYPDFTVRTYGRAEVDYQTNYVNTTFFWSHIYGGYWFRIGVISQDVNGLNVGDTYNVNCTELTYQFEHGQVVAPFTNYSIDIRSPEPFTITVENISGSATTSKVTINNTEQYTVYDIFFDRVLGGFQETQHILQLDPGESASYEIDKNSSYNFTVHFMPPWQKNCWSKYYYSSQAFLYSEAIQDTNPPEVTLDSPSDGYTYTTTYTITFRVSATDDVSLQNCTLYTNISGAWLANTTINYSGTSDTDTWTIDTGKNGSFIWNALCYDAAGFSAWHSSNYTVNINLTNQDNTPPIVHLIAPENDTTITAVDDLVLYASAEDDLDLDYCTLYTNISGTWQANQTKNFSGMYDADVWYIYNVSNGTYLWNVLCYDDAGNSAWNATNYTVHVSYSPPGGQTITEYVERGGGIRIQYVQVPVEVEVPCKDCIPEDRLELQLIGYPPEVSVTDREFEMTALVINPGENTLYNITVAPDVPPGFGVPPPVTIPKLPGGKGGIVNFTIEIPPFCTADSLNELPMISTLDHNFYWGGKEIKVTLDAHSGSLSASDAAEIAGFIPDFAVTTDKYEYYEGEMMTICIVANNLNDTERPKVEFELELYDDEKIYIGDYLTPYVIENDSIFLLKKSYILSYIPVNDEYPLKGVMFEEGALFTDRYSTGMNITYVNLTKGPGLEVALPFPLKINKWIARLALFFLLAAWLNMMAPVPAGAGGGAAAGGAAGAAVAPPLTLAGLCKKRICGKRTEDLCKKFVCKIPRRCKTKKRR